MKVLVLGCGEMGASAIEDLYKHGKFKDLIVATRNTEKANRWKPMKPQRTQRPQRIRPPRLTGSNMTDLCVLCDLCGSVPLAIRSV